MSSKVTRILVSMMTALALTVSAGVQANTVEETPSALAMTGDALFARPALFAMTVVGGAVYVVSLPFSLLGGNAEEAGEVLFMDPAKATFVRCLGCSQVGRKVSDVVEQQKKDGS